MAALKLSNGISISYHDSGSGTPILFLHSFGHNKSLWFPQLTHFLERGFRVLAPDMPGHGDSSYDPGHHGVDQMARCYIELLDCLRLGKVILAGISMGGYIALRMWARRPDLIAAMVLSNTKAEKDSDAIAARRRAQIENIHRNGLEHFVTTGAPKRLSPVTLERRPWVLDTIKLLNFTVPAEVNAATLEAMVRKEDDTEVLPTIDVPVLVTSGSDDVFIPQDSPGKLHEGIRGSRFHEIAGTGHVSSLEAPTEYNRVMEEFLQAAGFM
ncbi:MAG: alpha/beta fold hydrolase [Gammaproteobacteria bacterium]|nr:alpha/beta fold hydrolase [Gammaproteobacteria bacterium]